MGASTTWVGDKIELFEGELLVFKRPNSPNWYLRIWISAEKKYLQQSLKTKSQFDAIERAKAIYKETQVKVAKEEKVFTITLGEALLGYEVEEKKRERRGIIQTDWYTKKNTYLKNTFTHHFGEAKKVNDITDKEMSEFIDIRLKRCKRKQTIKQEIVIIKHFYKNYLIKKGYVFRIPEFPEFRLKQNDISRREDTFSIPEYEKLIRFMREWVKEKNVSKVRKAEKKYGKASNTEKVLNEWEWQMECHRRILLRELILIGANTGIRCPKEMLSLTWGDIKVRSETFKGLYTNPDKESEELIAYIQINQHQKTGARQVVGKAGDYFKRLKQYYRDQFNFNPEDHHPVFMDMVGRRKYQELDRYALYRLWGELMRDCNLTRIDFTLYSLRGFYITQSILNGIDITLISKNCGNSPATIYKHYEFIDMEANASKLVRRRDTRKEVANEVEI
jgi:site-specific recombinase XerD